MDLTRTETSVVQRLRRKRVANMKTLCEQLDVSHMTVVRALKKYGYFSSASSTLNLGVQSLQFRSGVVDFKLPVDASLLGVGLVGPDPDLGLERLSNPSF